MATKIADLQGQLEAERRLVSFDSYDLSVGQLLEMVSSGNVFVPPEYQRQFIWDPERQSVLVESVLLGIPIPSLFMATNKDATWEVVDGVQRIGSLSHFVATDILLSKIDRPKALIIAGLEKLSSLNGYRFQDLPSSVQLHFNTRPIRVTVLNDRSDLSVRFDLFERLNTGGVALTPQEIRNCVYRGSFNNDIKKLSGQSVFESVVKFGPNPAGGQAEEAVLRFFAYLDNYKKFDHSVKAFLNEYMEARREVSISKAERTLFRQTFQFLSETLPHGIVRSRTKTPINLYEAISVGVALIFKAGGTPNSKRIFELLEDPQLKSMTGGGSNNKKFVQGRIELVRDFASEL